MIDTTSTEVQEYVGHYNRVMKGEHHFFRILATHGRHFTKAVTEHKYPAGEPNFCFNNALRLALDNPELTYVEGYALSVIPVHHAWCVDLQGRVIDTTWDAIGREYFGIPFQTLYIRKQVLKTRYPCMMDIPNMVDLHRADPADFVSGFKVKL